MWVPHEYQQQAIRLMISQACAGLFLDPGLGKTAISLAASKILLDKKLVNGVLVIAPLRPAKNTWPAEKDKWEQFRDLDLVVLHGKDKDKLLSEKHDIYVINPEGLQWLFKATYDRRSCYVPALHVKALMQKFDMVIIDESTKFKSHSAKRFQLMKTLLPHWKRRYILTGTPAPNGLKDLWAQIYLLDGGAALSAYVTRFMRDYFFLQPFSHEYDYRPYPDAADRIAAKIAHLVLRMKAEDYLELPELTYNPIFVDLPPAARKQYDTLEEEFLLMLEEGVVNAVNSAVLSGKLRQVVAGAIYLPDQTVALNTAKIDALNDLIEELSGQPLLVGYDFKFEHDMLKEHVPEAVFLDGKHDDERIAAFNRGEIAVLAGNPASIGHGLNLQQACSHVAFLSLTWNLENFEQFIKRVLRQGNESKRVVCHMLMCRNTVDEAVWRTLQSKDHTQKSLLNMLQSLRK